MSHRRRAIGGREREEGGAFLSLALPRQPGL
jgi:hypothetical protein